MKRGASVRRCARVRMTLWNPGFLRLKPRMPFKEHFTLYILLLFLFSSTGCALAAAWTVCATVLAASH